MFLLAVTVYFLVACTFSWLTLFPAGREQTLRWCVRLKLRINHPRPRLVQHHYWSSLAGGIALFLPPILALMIDHKTVLTGFDMRSRAMNEQVTALLQGEQLTPPLDLPPRVFTTPEVAQWRPMLGSASRNWQLLHPDYAQRLLLTFKIMKEKHGVEMVMLEGYRSPERQTVLASMGTHITNAAAFQSWHQYGLAADCAFLRDGKIVISEKDPWAMQAYALYGAVAESVGMTWGGRWKMMDFGHTEWHVPGTLKRSQQEQ